MTTLHRWVWSQDAPVHVDRRANGVVLVYSTDPALWSLADYRVTSANGVCTWLKRTT